MGKIICRYLYKNVAGNTFEYTDANGTRWHCTATSRSRPYGCIVFIDKDHYGWACVAASDYRKNLSISKATMRKIATMRAKNGTNRQMPRVFEPFVESMRVRAGRYFK